MEQVRSKTHQEHQQDQASNYKRISLILSCMRISCSEMFLPPSTPLSHVQELLQVPKQGVQGKEEGGMASC